jgi:hypothetical protein
MQFNDTSILNTKTRYMDVIVREAIEIGLHPNNMNREVGFVPASHGTQHMDHIVREAILLELQYMDTWPLICSLHKSP